MRITKTVSVGLLCLFAVLNEATSSTYGARPPERGVDCAGPANPDVGGSAPGLIGTQYQTTVEEFQVVAPSGNTIYGLIRRPDPSLYGVLSFPAVVYIPGGINPGRLDAFGSPEVIKLAEEGMVVVTFNAEGRGDTTHADMTSEGSEDYNGFRHQDGLASIVNYVAALDHVIANNIGIRTQSFGITMAAGCVARHPGLPVRYIVDGEGPSESFVTAQEPWALLSDPSHPFHDKYQQVFEILGHYSTYRDPSAQNLAFWAEREADKFIGEFRGKYLRLQATWDHSQPPSNESEIPVFHKPPLWWQGKHTADMVNAAVRGGVPWVRVNLPEQGNLVNMTYDADNQPVFLAGELKDRLWGEAAVLEMAFSAAGDLPPAAITGDAAAVTATRAKVNASLVNKGTAANIAVSFQWGLEGNYTDETAPVLLGNEGPFAAELIGLVPGRTYQFKAKAVGDGTSYGIKRTFTTRIPVYDTNAGFVTGGGWIDSPAGAYMNSPSLAEKATFGFVSEYVKGMTVPAGNVEFQLKSCRLNFHSSSLDWFVVDQGGTAAEVHGNGTINGKGRFKFMLWVGDGTPDTLRMRIWEQFGGTETVHYDNDSGEGIRGGNIVVHRKR